MCKTCTAYEHQSKFIDTAIGKLFTGKLKVNIKMPEKKKNKILEEIKNS